MNTLMVAAAEGRPEGIKCIMQKMGNHVNAVDKNGRTALHFACAAGKSKNAKEIFKELQRKSWRIPQKAESLRT